jgi:WD40 repeat protein
VFFTPDGRSVVTADRHGRGAAVRVWDVATGKVVRQFAAEWKPAGRVWRTRLSPDGTVLAVQYQGETWGVLVESEVKLWELATGKEVAGPTPPWFDPEVMAMAPDGKSMIVARPPFGTTIEWQDLVTGQVRVRGELRGSREQVTALAVGPDGLVFTGAPDGTVLAWDTRVAKPRSPDRK